MLSRTIIYNNIEQWITQLTTLSITPWNWSKKAAVGDSIKLIDEAGRFEWLTETPLSTVQVSCHGNYAASRGSGLVSLSIRYLNNRKNCVHIESLCFRFDLKIRSDVFLILFHINWYFYFNFLFDISLFIHKYTL